jgi:hypothetical protein
MPLEVSSIPLSTSLEIRKGLYTIEDPHYTDGKTQCSRREGPGQRRPNGNVEINGSADTNFREEVQ